MIGVFELIALLGFGFFIALIIAVILIVRSQRRKKAQQDA
jgi:hypothetical protein